MKLLDCPFCGSKAGVAPIILRGGQISGRYEVFCIDEDCGAEISSFPSKEEAIKCWNTRVKEK